MVKVEPTNYDVLLVGPRVAQLEPFFKEWGYRIIARPQGTAGLSQMGKQDFHVVILELELEDLESHEFLADARQIQPNSAYLLLDAPTKTGADGGSREGGAVPSAINPEKKGTVPFSSKGEPASVGGWNGFRKSWRGLVLLLGVRRRS